MTNVYLKTCKEIDTRRIVGKKKYAPNLYKVEQTKTVALGKDKDLTLMKLVTVTVRPLIGLSKKEIGKVFNKSRKDENTL